jgi:hypothetical protein
MAGDGGARDGVYCRLLARHARGKLQGCGELNVQETAVLLAALPEEGHTSDHLFLTAGLRLA